MLYEVITRLHVTDCLEHKKRLLHHLAADPAVTRAIVFSATKRVITSYSIHYTKLYDTGARRGMASLCIGGGQGGAMLLERVEEARHDH